MHNPKVTGSRLFTDKWDPFILSSHWFIFHVVHVIFNFIRCLVGFPQLFDLHPSWSHQVVPLATDYNWHLLPSLQKCIFCKKENNDIETTLQKIYLHVHLNFNITLPYLNLTVKSRNQDRRMEFPPFSLCTQGS